MLASDSPSNYSLSCSSNCKEKNYFPRAAGQQLDNPNLQIFSVIFLSPPSILLLLLFSYLSFFYVSCSSLSMREADAFFSQPPLRLETFRVFISKEQYIVRQLQFHDDIVRIPDFYGDKEQLQFFTEEHRKINFKTFRLTGILNIQLNPHNGRPINIKYLPGRAPSIWQVGKHFINDLSRFRFEFPRGKMPSTELLVSYLWFVEQAPGADRHKAIEHLRKQKAR